MASQLAAQLYTLRDHTKTPADIARTLARVKKMGFDAVQSSALGPIDPKELASIFKNEGLTCCVTHVPLDAMRDKTQEVIDNHKLWGCSYTAIGGHGWKDQTNASWKQFARDYSDVARKFAGSGLSIGYHNHSHELIKYDGETAMDILLKNLSKDVWFEIDTYWIQHGGADPAAWIDKVAGRVPCVHVKDMGISPTENKQQMREVGEGNLNWPRILDACRRAGTKWYIIEQDNCNGLDPFECLERSLKNLKGMGIN
jgi:sugar phosphate isomerase/epimerase